jgi:hypothetical protein
MWKLTLGYGVVFVCVCVCIWKVCKESLVSDKLQSVLNAQTFSSLIDNWPK